MSDQAMLLATEDWELQSEDIGRLTTRNMYEIENPFSPDGISRITRPSLSMPQDFDISPIMGFYYQAGAINSRKVIIAGVNVYLQTAESTPAFLGVAPGTDYCDFTSVRDRVVFVRNGVAYSTDGISLTTINMPDFQLVGSVASINSYILLSILGSDRFYWIPPGEINPDPLDFATAERYPDAIQAIRVIFDEIWFPGETGPEVWSTTGDSDAPFVRINGRVYSEGCESFATCVSVLKNSLPALIWVTPNRTVVLAQGQVIKVSNASVDALLSTATNLRAWFFRSTKNDFWILTTDDFTLVYDITKSKWYRWDSYTYGYWRGHLGVQVGVNVYAGDALSGKIWKLGTAGFDETDTPIVKEVTGLFLSDDNDKTPCNTVDVMLSSGWTQTYDDPEPLELFLSDDLGFTWSDPFRESIGTQGKYAYEVQYRSLGSISRPGRVFRWRYSGLSKLRIDYAVMNQGQT